jgi:protein-S-isoprenylcysteine O-methyltransferase Ste14
LTVESAHSGRGPTPPVYFLVAIVAMVVIDWLVPAERLLSWPWRIAGALPVAGGLVLASVAERQFRRAGTAVRPFEPSSVLVTGGVFRFSRNPMYVGLVLALLGIGIGLGSAAPFVVVPVFVWLIAAIFVLPEERMMTEQFGDEYEAYRRRVRRWL